MKAVIYNFLSRLTCHTSSPLNLTPTNHSARSSVIYILESYNLLYLYVQQGAIVTQDQNHSLLLYHYYNISLYSEILAEEGSPQPEMCAPRQWVVVKVLQQLSIVSR